MLNIYSISALTLILGFLVGWFSAVLIGIRKIKSTDENLKNAFKVLAAEELEKSAKKLGEITGERDELLKLNLNHHKEAITNLLTPLAQKIELIDKERIETFGKLSNELRRVTEANEKLRSETGNLVNALRRPQIRGRWGEITLRRVVELSGMTSHIDFDEQESKNTSTGRQRPDMIIRLPQNRNIVVDSKVALDAYISAYEEPNEEKREELLKKHSQLTKTHIFQLSRKNYWENFSEGFEFVIMFMPNEAILEAAFQYDPTLLEYALQNGVIIATPSTLMAILQTIEFSWRQVAIRENAREISKIGKELYSRINTLLSHFDKIGDSIVKLIEKFNIAAGSLEKMLIPQLKRFKELGADDGKPVENIKKIDELPRSLDNLKQ